MITAIGLLTSSLLASLGLLHLYWAVGGTLGSTATIPTIEGRPAFVPTPLATVVVACLLFTAALLILGESLSWGSGRLRWLFAVGTSGVAVVFFLRAIGNFHNVGLFKRNRATRFARWDTWLYSPLCLAIALTLALVVTR